MQTRFTPLAALLSMAFMTSAQAETTLEPIVVTASRFESAQQERPIAAQVITAEEIRDSSATNVSEVLGKLGGVHKRINYIGLPDSPLDLRGFGMTGDQNTLVLLNGQRLSENEGAPARLSSIPVESIERIEILRGSGAVLYGGGASGGTINIITKSPIGSPLSGHVFTQAGSYNSRDVRGGIQAGGERWGMRLDAQHYETDNYRVNNKARTDNVNGEVRFGDAKDFVSLSFIADDQRAGLPGERSEAQLSTDRRGTSSPDDYLNSKSQLYAIRGEKNLGDVTLALDTGYREKDTRSMFTGSNYRSKNTIDVLSVSPRAIWKTSFGNLDNQLTVGVDWSDWSARQQGFNTPSGLQSSDIRGKQINRAMYLRNEIEFPTDTRVSLGVRREHIAQRRANKMGTSAEQAADYNLTAHEIAIQQALGAGFSAYARTGRSFRIANIDENGFSDAPVTQLLKPQKSRDSEVGLEWQSGKNSARIGLFNMDVTDEIHFNRLIGSWGSNTNLAPTRHRGIEVEGRLQVISNVDVTAWYRRTDAKFREGIYGGIDLSGKTVPLVPKDRIGVNLGWQITGDTRASVNVQYVGGQRYDNDQANRFRKMPSYTITDFKISHEIGDWRLAAGVNNLFDEDYYSYGIVNGTYTSFNAYPEARRTFYASAEYRF